MSRQDAVWDDWEKAFEALIAEPSNPIPLAKLLRSRVPMPKEAREVLAELLNPGSPELFFRRLVVKVQEDGFKKAARKIVAAQTFEDFRGRGMSAEKAALASANKHHIGDRSIFRWRQHRLEWRERMKQVLFDDDDEPEVDGGDGLSDPSQG